MYYNILLRLEFVVLVLYFSVCFYSCNFNYSYNYSYNYTSEGMAVISHRLD